MEIISKLQQSTFFHAAEDSSEQTGMFIKPGLSHFYILFFLEIRSGIQLKAILRVIWIPNSYGHPKRRVKLSQHNQDKEL